MPKMEVYGSQLQWARRHRNLTIAQAAKAIGITKSELKSYEDGSVKPDLGKVRKMGRVYTFPMVTFFLPNPPANLPSYTEDFRTVGGAVPDLSVDTLTIIGRIRAYQTKMAQIFESDDKFFAPFSPRYDIEKDPCAQAIIERHRLSITLKDQLAWHDEDDAFRKLRAILEDHGVYVYMEKLSIDECRGISILDHPKLPAIIVNKDKGKEPVAAKIFTLAHEYAHVLIGRPGISDFNHRNRVERFCNRFAAAFLAPEEAIRKVLTPFPKGVVDWEPDQIRTIARTLKISQQATALRLEELGLAREGFFASFKEGQQKRGGRKKNDRSVKIPQATLRLYSLGRRMPTAVISALDRGVISAVDATRILNVRSDTVTKMREKLGIQIHRQ